MIDKGERLNSSSQRKLSTTSIDTSQHSLLVEESKSITKKKKRTLTVGL